MGNSSSSKNARKKDNLIHQQQETIRKQQMLISKQQQQKTKGIQSKTKGTGASAKNPKISSGVAAASAAVKRQNTVNNNNLNLPNSNATSDINAKIDQMRGEFRCSLCKVEWKSDMARMGVGRECKKCHVNVYPANLQKIYPQVGSGDAISFKIDNTVQNNLKKAVTPKKCMNKEIGGKKTHLLGVFKCANCSHSWKCNYYGNSQKCNKCKTDVLPVSLTKVGHGRDNYREGHQWEVI